MPEWDSIGRPPAQRADTLSTRPPRPAFLGWFSHLARSRHHRIREGEMLKLTSQTALKTFKNEQLIFQLCNHYFVPQTVVPGPFPASDPMTFPRVPQLQVLSQVSGQGPFCRVPSSRFLLWSLVPDSFWGTPVPSGGVMPVPGGLYPYPRQRVSQFQARMPQFLVGGTPVPDRGYQSSRHE